MPYTRGRYGGSRSGRDRDRDNHFGPRGDREKSWNRNRNRPYFQTRDKDRYDRKDYHRFRRDRDEEVVMIRRDKERDDTNNSKRTSHHKDETKPEGIRRSPELRHPNPAHFSADKQHESRPFPNYGPPSNSLNWEDFNEDSNHPTYMTQPEVILPPRNEPLKDPPPQQPGPSRLSEKSQEIINSCIANFKTRGDYDRIRRECMLDIDTKPAFINAMGKVTDITNRFLQTATYHPNMDKARMRENLKKSFEMSKSYQYGLESLVNQILQPKISSILEPMIEKEIYRSLGLDTSTDATAAVEAQGSEPDALPKPPEGNAAAGENEVNNNDEVAPTTVSCLVPMNVIIDSKPELESPFSDKKQAFFRSTFKRVISPLPITNEVDLQLHQDILEELKEETKVVCLPKPELEDFVLPKLPEELPTDNQDESNDKLMSPLNGGNDLEGKEEEEPVIHTVTKDSSSPMDLEPDKEPELEEKLEEDGGDPEDQGGDFDEEEEIEEDSDDESPAFENFGEVSPVRVDIVPDYEFTPPSVEETGLGMECPSTTSPPSEDSAHQLPESDPSKNSNEEKTSEQDLCKFLDPLDLTDKLLYFKKITKLSG